ncbi:hypothetical protein F4820DRAFT_451053 [Hypoxylon rubiginosum]|uniref:Uncharacterized protein n=1 Tax=Hypoxylon rubiginosum TaxID=110542 RepID=A0ACB9YT62_9PEZI|nr:hypothetical protein F4820DRAFT_451053 [Hypoxylon rubiginosum]
MESSEAYQLLGVAPGASKAEIERAFRLKALACHPDRMMQGGDKAEQAARVLRATEDMKALNAAKSLLLEIVPDELPEPAHDPDCPGCQEDRLKPPMPPRFPREERLVYDLRFDVLSNAENISVEGPYVPELGEVVPTEKEYHNVLRDLAGLYAEFCKTVEAIAKNLHHSDSCMVYWDPIMTALNMAGATMEEIWEIVYYLMSVDLRVIGKVNRTDWARVEMFIKHTRQGIAGVQSVVSRWFPDRERESCLKLYSVLGALLIANRRLCDPSWKAKYRAMHEAVDDWR